MFSTRIRHTGTRSFARLQLALVASLLLGCASAAAPAQAPSGGSMLADCTETALAPDVRAWECGQLTAVETLVLSADQHDIELAFDGFAQRFGGSNPKRVDSVYARGDARHTVMRLEANGALGNTIDAQMVAVSQGSGVRLVTCSSKDAKSPCGPVIDELVHGLAGPKQVAGARGLRVE